MNIKSLLSTVIVLVGSVASVMALENEVWISPIGPAATLAANSYPAGTIGSPTYPFRCPDPATLDWVLTQELTGAGLTIHFMAGTFDVLPAYRSSVGINIGVVLKRGWKIVGAGMNETTLRIMATNLNNVYTMALWGPNTNPGGGEVSDLTVDCNTAAQTNAAMVGAITLKGSDTRIARVKAINWGTRLSSYECFVLVVAPPNSDSATNCIIENCIVTHPANITFADGVTAISVFGPTIAGIMRENLVCDITAGTGSGQPNYVNAYCHGGTISHNRAYRILAGVGEFIVTLQLIWNASWWATSSRMSPCAFILTCLVLDLPT